jgi:hypothetical protein
MQSIQVIGKINKCLAKSASTKGQTFTTLAQKAQAFAKFCHKA